MTLKPRCNKCSAPLDTKRSRYKTGSKVCRECRNKADRARYLKRTDTDRVRSRKWHREHYQKPYVKEARADEFQRRIVIPTEKEKKRIRDFVWHKIRSGKLKREPCEVCGNMRSQAHHEDYSKPLEVVWLCAFHHKARHREINE